MQADVDLDRIDYDDIHILLVATKWLLFSTTFIQDHTKQWYT